MQTRLVLASVVGGLTGKLVQAYSSNALYAYGGAAVGGVLGYSVTSFGMEFLFFFVSQKQVLELEGMSAVAGVTAYTVLDRVLKI